MPFAESQNSSTGKDSQAKKPRIKPTTRLMGEICFQLDRKMLNSVFRNKEHQRRRFYGYIIQNIMHKIDKECVVDDNTGMIDAQKKNILQFRSAVNYFSGLNILFELIFELFGLIFKIFSIRPYLKIYKYLLV